MPSSVGLHLQQLQHKSWTDAIIASFTRLHTRILWVVLTAAFLAELWAVLQGEGGPPGYPTLRTLVVEPELRAAGVDVLGQASKKESLILKVKVRPPDVS